MEQILISIVLGVIQGVTEFLPVSSDGHLELAKHLFGFEAGLLFTVLLHVGTLIAVLIVFRKKIFILLAALWRFVTRKQKDGDRLLMRLWLLLIIATAATVPVALLAGKANDYVNANPKLIGVCFLVTAAALILTAFLKGARDYDRIHPLKGLIIGAAQGLAVFSGVSRSGLTISSSMACGMKRENAGEYSFLLAIPAILGALVFELKDAPSLLVEVSLPALIAGILAAFGTGLLAIIILLKLIKTGKLWVFSLYLVPLGIVTMILL